jgi:hypothetical protein
MAILQLMLSMPPSEVRACAVRRLVPLVVFNVVSSLSCCSR